MINTNTTPFKILSDGVLDRLKSSGLPGLTEDIWDEDIFSHIRTACIKFKSCKQPLIRDDLLQQFNVVLTDEETEILISLLLIEFLSKQYINVPSLLRENLTSKDFQSFSSRNHLDGLVNLRDTYKREVKQMMSAYSNHDSDLFARLKRMRGQTPSTPEPDEDI